MSLLKATRGVQYPLVASFTIDYDDSMVDTGGTERTFPLATDGTYVFDVAALPVGAVILGGNLVVEDLFYIAGTGTITLDIGTETDPDAFSDSAPISLEVAGVTALTYTSTAANEIANGENLRLTFVTTGDPATAGRMHVNLMYVLPGRINEVTAR